jgi:hypothetical protein
MAELLLQLGLEKKLELDELARARSSSARLGPARRFERARAEPIFLAREKSEPARLGSFPPLAPVSVLAPSMQGNLTSGSPQAQASFSNNISSEGSKTLLSGHACLFGLE